MLWCCRFEVAFFKELSHGIFLSERAKVVACQLLATEAIPFFLGGFFGTQGSDMALFVGRLDNEVKAEELEELFKQYGEVQRCANRLRGPWLRRCAAVM